MNRTSIILFIALTGALFYCKEKPIGVAYVVGDRVPVFAKPDRFLQPLKALPRDTKIEILENQVPDPRAPERAFWYRVRSGDLSGFISYDEELVRKNVASFKDVARAQSALVTATSLRLRQDPTLSAKVLMAMPRLTVVDVLQEGSLRQKIGKKEDTWVKVRTAGGKEGFSFSGFLHRGNPEEIRRLAKAEFEIIDGFVYAKAESPKYLNEPGGRPVTEEDPVTGGQHELSLYPRAAEDAGARYARVTARLKHKDKLWYHVEETNCDIMTCTALNAWVAGDEVEYVKDFFQHTLSHAKGERNIPLLREVRSSLDEGEVLHAGKTEYEEISLVKSEPAEAAAERGQGGGDEEPPPKAEVADSGAPAAQPAPAPGPGAVPVATTIGAAAMNTATPVPTRHYLVKAAIGTRGEIRNIVLAETGKSFRTLGSFSFPRFRDIDGDGRAELISDESERADTTYSVFTYAGAGRGFRKILNFSHDSGVQFADPYLIFQDTDSEYFKPGPPFEKKFAKAKERVLVLEQGKYREIPAADVPKEAREKNIN